MNENLLLLLYSVIGIFLNININKSNPKFSEFIEKIANTYDLKLEPFIQVFNIIQDLNYDYTLKNSIEKYKNFIDEIFNLKINKKEKMTVKY